MSLSCSSHAFQILTWLLNTGGMELISAAIIVLFANVLLAL